MHIACKTCGVRATHMCSACKANYYCSRECFGNDIHYCGSVVGFANNDNATQVDDIMRKYRDLRNWEWEQHKGNRRFFEFRKQLVDALLRRVIAQVGCRECSATSVGSTTLYSDYDLTVSGPKSAEIVDEFNRQFRKLFAGKESAVVFDTNIYGAGFYEVHKTGNFSLFAAAQQYFKYVADAQDEQAQREWALLKVYMHLNDDEKRRLAPRFATARAKQQALNAANDIKSRNVAYVKSLYVVSRLKAAMNEPTAPANVALRKRYKEAVSVANYYGAETYFTQGAFMHVVGEIQSKIATMPITRDEYMDSFVENTGECLKELSSAACGDENLDSALERMSKYFARAMHALLRIPDTANDGGISKLYQASERLRLKVRGHEKRSACVETEDATCVRPETARALREAFKAALNVKRNDGCLSLRAVMLDFLFKYAF